MPPRLHPTASGSTRVRRAGRASETRRDSMAGRLGAALSRVRDEIAGSGRVWAGGGRQANSSMLRPYEKWVATTRRQSSRAERHARQRAQRERRARISAAKASAEAAVAGLQRYLRWGVRVAHSWRRASIASTLLLRGASAPAARRDTSSRSRLRSCSSSRSETWRRLRWNRKQLSCPACRCWPCGSGSRRGGRRRLLV